MKDQSREHLAQFSAEALALVGLSAAIRERFPDGEGQLDQLEREAESVAALAAKAFPGIFPAAHQALIDAVACVLEPAPEGIRVRVTLKGLSKTPLQAMAQHAAAAAGVLVAEHFRREDPAVAILELRLMRSEGGRRHPDGASRRPLRAAVIVLSDARASGECRDESGPLIRHCCEALGIRIEESTVIPDDPAEFERLLLRSSDTLGVDLIISSGGTGLGPRDKAPEITQKLIDREIPGVSEAIRAHGQQRVPFAMLSRGVAGIRGKTLILNLPGSPAGVAESLDAVMPELLRAFTMMEGGGHP